MFDVIKAAIEAGSYKLDAMLSRIHTFAAKGYISADQMAELESMARGKADVSEEVSIFAKVAELENRIRALEMGAVATPPSTESYDDYVPGKWYYGGDKASFNGKNYVCTAPEGIVCVWSPSEYPTYWREVA